MPATPGQASNGVPHASSSGSAQSGEDLDLTSPANLRKLVLNYLVHHCYADTAAAFANDGISGASSGPGLNSGAGRQPSGSDGVPISGDTGSRNGASAKASGSGSRQAHPLSAPPLSREDSSMEVEADSLLALATSASSATPMGRGGRSAAGSDGMDEDDAAGSSATATHARVASNGNGAHADDGDPSRELNRVPPKVDDTADYDEDSDLPPAELRALEIRKEIRAHIINGRIRAAIDLCNTHFPAVLDVNNSKGKGHVKSGNEDSATTATPPAGHTSTSSSHSERVLPANPTSLEPAHLLLNLQIQVFIEIVRSATSSSNLGGSAASLPPGSSPQISSSGFLPLAATNTPGISAASISRAASPAPSSSSSTGSGTSVTGGGSGAAVNPALHSALAVAQGLYTSAQKLPSYWRAMYLKELEQVTALLAYADVEHSPVRKFLHRSRKVALAEQVNSAILFRTGKPSQPLIESTVRQTAFIYSSLHSDKVAVPNGHPLFGVAGCPAGPYEETLSKKNGGGKILPPWNFRSFLAER